MSLMTVEQAAKLMSVCTRTVYNMANDGRIPVVRMRGRSLRIHREKLEAMLEEEAAASIRAAGGVKEKSCRTNEETRPTGGSATSFQMESTLDDLLGQKTTRQPRR
ncbi:helix-turn-helix domain-containing protein [Azotobacter chroococcum]|uniref:Helix-turn-helix domain-containing protein n=2 Tax=Azotobacter chroococcum TaxID=353 RepID=A0AA43Z7X9_9GAMM|nr:helix-turn-helix domain-containing protein [Azotobacter chroococcum]